MGRPKAVVLERWDNENMGKYENEDEVKVEVDNDVGLDVSDVSNDAQVVGPAVTDDAEEDEDDDDDDDDAQVVGPAVTDDAEEDEESMDWWTKYFASIDTMIEVSLMMISLPFVIIHFSSGKV